MPTLHSALALIRYHEGLRRKVYDDATGHGIVPGAKVTGHPTIGYGRALDVRGITTDEANYLLQNDIVIARAAAGQYPWFRDLNEPRQAVIVDMIHNLGAKGFSKFRRTIRAIDQGDYERAAVEMLSSLWAEQVGKRATHLAGIMVTGTWEGTSV